MFYCVDTPWEDPARNLAAEEFLLRSGKKEFVMFYVNAPAVIVGKHQNVFREVNLAFTGERGIPVVRRLTGGGTVYHDRGNLNFSFILTGEKGRLVDFARYTRPIVEFLQHAGVPAVTDDRNNILIGKDKISGNAEHIFKDRVLHHGTLLFDASLTDLEEALQPHPGGVTDKAIPSRRSRVTNIVLHMKRPVTLDTFRQELKAWCMERFSPCREYHFSEDDQKNIATLVKEKYGTWEWNVAYSPASRLMREAGRGDGKMQMEIFLEKGRVKKILFPGKPAGDDEYSYVAQHLTGVPFRREAVHRVLERLSQKGKLSVISQEEWLRSFFG